MHIMLCIVHAKTSSEFPSMNLQLFVHSCAHIEHAHIRPYSTIVIHIVLMYVSSIVIIHPPLEQHAAKN